MSHILVAGSVNADIVLSLARVPAKGETLAARGLATHPGGKVRKRSSRQCRARADLCQRRRSCPLTTACPSAAARPSLLMQGGNQAAAAARLGCPTRLVAQVGRDAQAGM